MIENSKRNLCPVLGIEQNETTRKLVCSLTSLLNAEKRCKRNVVYKNSVARFDMLKLSKCYQLKTELDSGEYTTRIGSVFKIFEPKFRLVTSTPIKDRVIQSSFVTNYMYKYIIPTHIKNNCACTRGKGVEFARNLLKDFLRKANKNEYVLKLDLKDYFGSIIHDKLFDELSRYFDVNSWEFWYFKDVINCNNQSKGIGLGSEIDQLSAVTFLSNIDHKIKGKYLRYMDDIVFIGTKDECLNTLALYKVECAKLNILVSSKKTYIQPITQPISFLGFTFLFHENKKPSLKREKRKVNKEKRKLKRMVKLNVPLNRMEVHYQSVRATYKKGCRSGVVKLDKYFREVQLCLL